MMRAFNAREESRRAGLFGTPHEVLRIAVTFPRPQDRLGPVRAAERLTAESVGSYIPDQTHVRKALADLEKRGFRVSAEGRITASVRGPRELFEKVFGTKLSLVNLDPRQSYSCHSFFFPSPDAPWKPDPTVAELLDDAYIQWPHIYMAPSASPKRRRPRKMAGKATSAQGPSVSYYHLEMPADVPRLLNAERVHEQGTTGKGVVVAMVDSGFYHQHPFFRAHGFSSSVFLAPGANQKSRDGNGHGTGESTNIFSVAPEAIFIGIKVDNEDDPRLGASILEGFQVAMQHNPKVVSISMGYDLRVMDPATGRPTLEQLSQLPNNLKALEAEIQAAIANGVVVVFSAGNGHYSFPGMMPEVVSAGGVFVDQNGGRQASNYASAFESKVYPGRHVPDFCGLVGLQPYADYIMLPIPTSCEIDLDNSKHDGTRPDDGWGVFSGTSAAAPQLAGICALLLEKNPGLKPKEIGEVLRRTCQDVTTGSANESSDESGQGLRAGPGPDPATGAGLVDAFAAWQQV